METVCPDCTTSLSIPNPGTDPGETTACQECGSEVQTGAFLCPVCDTGLQVERSLLPAEGGNGRCPDCSEVVWIPPLASSTTAAAPIDADAMSAAPAGSDEDAVDAASHVLGEGVAEEADPPSFLDETRSVQRGRRETRLTQPAPAPGRRGTGFVVGFALGAVAAAALIVTDTWMPPQLSWADSFPFANLLTWSAAAALAAGLLGMLFGGRRG